MQAQPNIDIQQLLTYLNSAAVTPQATAGYGDIFATHADSNMMSPTGQLAQGIPYALLSWLFGSASGIPKELLQYMPLVSKLGEQSNHSLMFDAMMQNNSDVFGSLATQARQHQLDTLNQFFGPKSVFQEVYNAADDGTKAVLDGIRNVVTGNVSTPFGKGLHQFIAPQLYKGLSSLTGDTTGESISLINARSLPVMAGMGLTSLHGSFSDSEDVRANLYNSLSKDFVATQSAVGSLTFQATRDLMQNEDGSRNKNLYGASEKVVGLYLSRFLETGQLDNELRDGQEITEILDEYTESLGGHTPNEVKRLKLKAKHAVTQNALRKARQAGASDEEVNKLLETSAAELKDMQELGMTAEDMGDLSMSDVVLAQAQVNKRQDQIVTRLRDLHSERRNRELIINSPNDNDQETINKAKTELESINTEIRTLESESSTLGTSLTYMSRIIKNVSKDLVEAVAGTVDSLKDLYGSESGAAQALSNITGGRDLDPETARALMHQIDDYKLSANAAGIDMKTAGRHLAQNVKSIYGNWDTRYIQANGTLSSMAIEMSNLSADIQGSIADPVAKTQFRRSMEELMPRMGDSDGARTFNLFEYAKEQGLFKNQESLLADIEEGLDSNKINEFRVAQDKLLTVLGGGSKSAGWRIYNDDRLVSSLLSNVSQAGLQRAAVRFSRTFEDEIKDKIFESETSTIDQTTRDRLSSFGMKHSDIKSLEFTVKSQTIEDELNNLSEDNEVVKSALDATQSEIDNKTKDIKDEKQIAQIKHREYVKTLNTLLNNGEITPDDYNRIMRSAAQDFRREAGAPYEQVVESKFANGDPVYKVLSDARVLSASGEFTVGGALQVTKDLYTAYLNNNITGFDLSKEDRDEIKAERKAIEEGLRSDDPTTRENAMGLLAGRFQKLHDMNPNAFLFGVGNLFKGNVYHSKATVEAEHEMGKLSLEELERKKQLEAERSDLSKKLEDLGVTNSKEASNIIAAGKSLDEEYGLTDKQKAVDELSAQYKELTHLTKAWDEEVNKSREENKKAYEEALAKPEAERTDAEKDIIEAFNYYAEQDSINKTALQAAAERLESAQSELDTAANTKVKGPDGKESTVAAEVDRGKTVEVTVERQGAVSDQLNDLNNKSLNPIEKIVANNAAADSIGGDNGQAVVDGMDGYSGSPPSVSPKDIEIAKGESLDRNTGIAEKAVSFFTHGEVPEVAQNTINALGAKFRVPTTTSVPADSGADPQTVAGNDSASGTGGADPQAVAGNDSASGTGGADPQAVATANANDGSGSSNGNTESSEKKSSDKGADIDKLLTRMSDGITSIKESLDKIYARMPSDGSNVP